MEQHTAFADYVEFLARNRQALISAFIEMKSKVNELGLKVSSSKRPNRYGGLEVEDRHFQLKEKVMYLGAIITHDNQLNMDI